MSQYVPEKVKIYTNQLKTCQTILTQLVLLQEEFINVGNMNTKERSEYFANRTSDKKNLKISF
jgi:hypothetical protein